jgi:adenylate cyclase
LTSHALAVALTFGAVLGHFERNRAEVERLASDAIELSTRQDFATWLPATVVLRGWARSALGDIREDIEWIVDGLRNMRAGASLTMPFMLALKSEALYLAGRTPDALEAIKEAEALAERSEECWWCAELHRLRGVFLAALALTKPR